VREKPQSIEEIRQENCRNYILDLCQMKFKCINRIIYTIYNNNITYNASNEKEIIYLFPYNYTTEVFHNFISVIKIVLYHSIFYSTIVIINYCQRCS